MHQALSSFLHLHLKCRKTVIGNALLKSSQFDIIDLRFVKSTIWSFLRLHRLQNLQQLHHQFQQQQAGACRKLVLLMLNCRRVSTMPVAKAQIAAPFNQEVPVSYQILWHHMLLMPLISTTRLLQRIHGTVISQKRLHSRPKIPVKFPF